LQQSTEGKEADFGVAVDLEFFAFALVLAGVEELTVVSKLMKGEIERHLRLCFCGRSTSTVSHGRCALPKDDSQLGQKPKSFIAMFEKSHGT
jgi:hypothetical protein